VPGTGVPRMMRVFSSMLCLIALKFLFAVLLIMAVYMLEALGLLSILGLNRHQSTRSYLNKKYFLTPIVSAALLPHTTGFNSKPLGPHYMIGRLKECLNLVRVLTSHHTEKI